MSNKFKFVRLTKANTQNVFYLRADMVLKLTPTVSGTLITTPAPFSDKKMDCPVVSESAEKIIEMLECLE